MKKSKFLKILEKINRKELDPQTSLAGMLIVAGTVFILMFVIYYFTKL